MPIICLMVRENHKMVREMSGKSQEILWGLMAGHTDSNSLQMYNFCFILIQIPLDFVTKGSINHMFGLV